MASIFNQHSERRSFLEKSAGIVGCKQTYRNLLYLVLAFPLGLFYFTVLTSGFILGMGLSITLIGIPLLLAIVVGSRYLVSLERWLANTLLGLDLPASSSFPTADERFWTRITSVLAARSTWLGLSFLYVRFALGLASFVLVAVSFTLAATLMTAPLHYADPNFGISLGAIHIDTFNEALLAVPLGLLVGLISLHVYNVVAWVSGRIAVVFLNE